MQPINSWLQSFVVRRSAGRIISAHLSCLPLPLKILSAHLSHPFLPLSSLSLLIFLSLHFPSFLLFLHLYSTTFLSLPSQFLPTLRFFLRNRNSLTNIYLAALTFSLLLLPLWRLPFLFFFFLFGGFLFSSSILILDGYGRPFSLLLLTVLFYFVLCHLSFPSTPCRIWFYS